MFGKRSISRRRRRRRRWRSNALNCGRSSTSCTARSCRRWRARLSEKGEDNPRINRPHRCVLRLRTFSLHLNFGTCMYDQLTLLCFMMSVYCCFRLISICKRVIFVIFQSNLKIQATRLQHEIEDYQRRVDNIKMKLTAEMKVHPLCRIVHRSDHSVLYINNYTVETL